MLPFIINNRCVMVTLSTGKFVFTRVAILRDEVVHAGERLELQEQRRLDGRFS